MRVRVFVSPAPNACTGLGFCCRRARTEWGSSAGFAGSPTKTGYAGHMAEVAWDRACNDNGPGGVCTWCDALHTVTVVKGCDWCHRPPDECRCVVVGTLVIRGR